MKFHLELFSLTLSFQWPISPNLFKITRVTISDG